MARESSVHGHQGRPGRGAQPSLRGALRGRGAASLLPDRQLGGRRGAGPGGVRAAVAPLGVGCATGTPPSARPTTRTCGNAACSPRCVFGRPNAAALAGVSATSRVVPSIASTRYPRYHAPLVSGVANGRATSTNSRRSGSAPSRALALAIAGVEGTRHHCCQRPVQPSPTASSRATSS